MALLDYLLARRKKTAPLAKERLQLILAREHAERRAPDFLPALRRELLEVIARHVRIDLEQVQVNLDRDGNCEILDINIPLSEVARVRPGLG